MFVNDHDYVVYIHNYKKVCFLQRIIFRHNFKENKNIYIIQIEFIRIDMKQSNIPIFDWVKSNIASYVAQLQQVILGEVIIGLFPQTTS